MNILIALAMALSIASSSAPMDAQPAPSQATTQAPTQALSDASTQAPSQAQCEEDQPCWDCATMGNTICGPTPVLAKEAWEAFSTEGFTEDELSEAFKATYRGTTAAPADLPDGHEWYTVESHIQPRLHHVFEIEFGATR